MCGCGGSIVTSTQQGIEARRVEGGPGAPGYTWNGPVVPAAAPREATPAATVAPSE